MEIVRLIISLDGIRLLVLGVFLVIILTVFFKFLVRPDNEEKSMQKVIGGLAVFCVAIISQSEWVMALSLFIGGLIIASEKFMKSLAAILKSESADLPETINALSEPEILVATDEEIEQKEKEEQAVLASSGPARLSQHLRMSEETMQDIKEMEEKVMDFFRQRYGTRFESQVKLVNEHGSVVVDGIIKDTAEPDTPVLIIEIKRVDEGRKTDAFLYRFRIRHALEKIRYLFLPTPLLMAFVVENEQGVDAEALAAEVEKWYSKVQVALFSFARGELKPLRLPLLKIE